jgi:hypothetical protein
MCLLTANVLWLRKLIELVYIRNGNSCIATGGYVLERSSIQVYLLYVS